jgi:hypothetical protein
VVHLGLRYFLFARVSIRISARCLAVWVGRGGVGSCRRSSMVVGSEFSKGDDMAEEIPVACCLSDEELRSREATLLAQFKSSLVTTEELADGYLLRVPGDKKWIAIAAELIMAERECCPFLRFELTAEPGMGPVTIRMTGPSGTKEILKSLLM